MKQNPFSLYDFLGYFIPGALCISLVYFITELKLVDHVNFRSMIDLIPEIKIETAVIFLILSYIFGHFLSYASSMSVEKYSIWKYGYPSKYLLSIKASKYFDHFKSRPGLILGVLMTIILLPIAIPDLLFGNLLKLRIFYAKPVDKFLRDSIVHKLLELFDSLKLISGDNIDDFKWKRTDFFRIIQHYTYEHTQSHHAKYNNYVALYGFLRTITFILNMVFWYLLIHFCYLGFSWNSIFALLALMFLSYVFFMSFMKFYRRFSLEAYMILVIDTFNNDHPIKTTSTSHGK